MPFLRHQIFEIIWEIPIASLKLLNRLKVYFLIEERGWLTCRRAPTHA
jgi:hypothetical protein